MFSPGLPFNPLRESLYTPADLFAAFDLDDGSSYEKCADISVLSYFVRMGKNPTRDSGASTLEALHDNSISQAVQTLLTQHQDVVAVMGGHGMVRGSNGYVEIARLAHELA